MTIYENFDNIQGEYAACIGFFDGVHQGHRYLLNHVIDSARANGLKSAVVTFINHPRKLMQPENPLYLIDTPEEKLAKLEELGLDACFLMEFTPEVRNLSAQRFISEMLSSRLHIRQLHIGYDHRFGKGRLEGFEDYVRYGAACGMRVVEEKVYDDRTGRNYSSSEVRRALTAGEVVRATELLGRPFVYSGTVVSGFQLGRKLGFPTANLESPCPDKLLPSFGVYACEAVLDNGMRYPAMLNIGVRPTVLNTVANRKPTDNQEFAVSAEANLIGFSGNIYGQTVTLHFIARIRDERRMPSLLALQEQLTKDCKKAVSIVNQYNEGAYDTFPKWF